VHAFIIKLCWYIYNATTYLFLGIIDESVNNDNLEAILKAVILMDKISGSQKKVLEIKCCSMRRICITNGIRGLHVVDNWPTTWQAATKLLFQNGYKLPVSE